MSHDMVPLYEPKQNFNGTTRKNNDHLFQNMAKQNVPYPVGENITAVEIVTFLTNWLREYDVVFRLASNGASNSLLTEMINHHRDPSDKGEVMNNSVCKLTQTAVRSIGVHQYPVFKDIEDDLVEVKFDPWSIHHHNQDQTKDYWGPWDHKSLAVGDVHVTDRFRASPLQSVDFEFLADGLKCYPSLENGDGLDLTRCVLYAKANPGQYKFPDDFSAICDIIGRQPVEDKHYDDQAFQRWARKYQDDKKVARAARVAAPSTGVAKTTRTKINKSRFVDPNNKVNKLKAKIEEAVQNGRLALGVNGQLILLDKPKVKVDPVDPAGGNRTRSSAINSPVKPDTQGGYNSPAGEPGSGLSTLTHNSPTGAADHSPHASGHSYGYAAGSGGQHSLGSVHKSQAGYQTNGVTFSQPATRSPYLGTEYGANGSVVYPFNNYNVDGKPQMVPGNDPPFQNDHGPMGQVPRPLQPPMNMQYLVQNDIADGVGFPLDFEGMSSNDHMFDPFQLQGDSVTGENWIFRGQLNESLPFQLDHDSPRR